MRKLFLIIFLVALVALSSCNSSNSVGQVESQENLQPEQRVEQSLEIVNPLGIKVYRFSFSELAHVSDAIIIGEVVGVVDGYINLARSGENSTEPDSRIFHIGQVYEVSVDEYLKGEDKDTIFVVQRRGMIGRGPGMDEISKEDIDLALDAGQGGEPLKFGLKYLMFLFIVYQTKEFTKEPLYSGVEDPWVFAVSDSDMVVNALEIPEDVTANFPPKPFEIVIKEINTPYVAPVLPIVTALPDMDDPYPVQEEGWAVEDEIERTAPTAYP